MSDPLWFWPTAYGWEVLFLLMSMTGTIASVFGVLDSWIARRDIKRRNINGERLHQAAQHLFEETSRFIALGIMMYGGVYVTSTSPSAAPQTIFVLNSVAFILNMKAIQDYRFRKGIREGRWTRGVRDLTDPALILTTIQDRAENIVSEGQIIKDTVLKAIEVGAEGNKHGFKDAATRALPNALPTNTERPTKDS